MVEGNARNALGKQVRMMGNFAVVKGVVGAKLDYASDQRKVRPWEEQRQWGSMGGGGNLGKRPEGQALEGYVAAGRVRRTELGKDCEWVEQGVL